MNNYQITIQDEQVALVSINSNMLGLQQFDKLVEEIGGHIENGILHFIVDLTDVDAINSSGLGVLLTILTKSRNANGDTLLCGVPEKLDRLFIITKLNAIFSVFPNKTAALTALMVNEEQ